MWYPMLSNRNKRVKLLRGTIVLGLLVVLSLGGLVAADLFRSISSNIRTYNNVVKNLLAEYVDDIDSEKLIISSIEGMLKDLDPYTVFISEEGQTEMHMLTDGQYSGVGIQLGLRGEVLTVIAPMEGSPAYRAGVRPGDKIIEIDGVRTKDYTTQKAAGKIRGKAGTSVVLTLRRPGVSDPIDVNLVRETIKVNDIPYVGVDDGIGYIRLNRFSRDTAKQFQEAVKHLQEQDIAGLVLDLRGNPGGLLSDAVAMVDAMVQPGVPIVETRGRTARNTVKHPSRRSPILTPETPLAILVDGGSASASEIVAGAIQDLDRGIIIGRDTFGKGLVQNIYDLGNDNALKMTTAKYYIPSGRLIQKEDYLHNGVLTDGLDKHDSLFVTRGGRIVKGGGGIIPDIEIERQTLSPMTRGLLMQQVFFSFATENQEKYDLTLPIEISDQILTDFRAYMTSRDVEITFPGEKDMQEFEKTVTDLENFEGTIDISELKAYYERRGKTAFDEELTAIKRGLALEFAAVIGGLGERIHASLADDPGYLKAAEIIKSPVAYQRILTPQENASASR